MHYLHLVSFLQPGRIPLLPADHSLVEFNSDLFCLQAQTGDQFREGDVVFHLSRLAVNLNKQEFADLTGQDESRAAAPLFHHSQLLGPGLQRDRK